MPHMPLLSFRWPRALKMNGDKITEARLAVGGVAHKPWRDPQAETLLHGQSASRDNFERVAKALLQDAKAMATIVSRSSWRSSPLCAA